MNHLEDPPTRFVLGRDGQLLGAAIDGVPRATAQVSALMTHTPYCVRDDVVVGAVVKLLLDRAIGGVPVVDDEGRPIGIVSKTDLLRPFCDDAVERTVGEIMTTMVVSVGARAPISAAVAAMARAAVHRIAVTDDQGAVVGILSALDIVRWIAQLYAFGG